MDAEGNVYRAPEDEIPSEDRARYDGYEKGKAETELETSRLLLQVATERERAARAIGEREEALAERDETESRVAGPADEGQVELAAKRIFDHVYRDGPRAWEASSEAMRDEYRGFARAALAASPDEPV